eukprot:3918950-Rhodomonas_salina.3
MQSVSQALEPLSGYLDGIDYRAFELVEDRVRIEAAGPWKDLVSQKRFAVCSICDAMSMSVCLCGDFVCVEEDEASRSDARVRERTAVHFDLLPYCFASAFCQHCFHCPMSRLGVASTPVRSQRQWRMIRQASSSASSSSTTTPSSLWSLTSSVVALHEAHCRPRLALEVLHSSFHRRKPGNSGVSEHLRINAGALGGGCDDEDEEDASGGG